MRGVINVSVEDVFVNDLVPRCFINSVEGEAASKAGLLGFGSKGFK